MSRRKILYDVIQNGGSYIEGYQNRIDGNSIIANFFKKIKPQQKLGL